MLRNIYQAIELLLTGCYISVVHLSVSCLKSSVLLIISPIRDKHQRHALII